MNYEDVTLSKLALASFMYDRLTPFNRSLKLLDDGTASSIDLRNDEDRRLLLEWLNDWGCRNLAQGQHDVASKSIEAWYEAEGSTLFPDTKSIWELEVTELKAAAQAYGALKDRAGALRVRGGSTQEVRIGPTAASKILFAMRRKALMPWDEAMRLHFKCDGGADSYLKYLTQIKNLALHIGGLCQNKGFQVEDLPSKLGRPESTVIELINEYIWVTATRQVELPSSATLARWAELG